MKELDRSECPLQRFVERKQEQTGPKNGSLWDPIHHISVICILVFYDCLQLLLFHL